MGRRQLKSDDVDGFMLAAWDDCADLERSWGLRVHLRGNAATTRGQFRFTAHADGVYFDTSVRQVAMAEVVWPTHSATSVHALLYALLVRLERAVCEAWEEEHWETGSPYSGLAASGE